MIKMPSSKNKIIDWIVPKFLIFAYFGFMYRQYPAFLKLHCLYKYRKFCRESKSGGCMFMFMSLGSVSLDLSFEFQPLMCLHMEPSAISMHHGQVLPIYKGLKRIQWPVQKCLQIGEDGMRRGRSLFTFVFLFY